MVEAQHTVLKSFIPYDENHPFPLENIPFGAFINHNDNNSKHCCTRIGDFVIDLALLEAAGLFNGPHFSAYGKKDIFN
jgi:fumarylacetoacetase